MEKNRLEKVRKHVFYKHINNVTKYGGKTREKIFSRNTDFASKQHWKKIVLKKCENTFFYKHTNIVTKKWGGKNARKIFSKNTRISRVLNDGKKSSGKSAKTRFL